MKKEDIAFIEENSVDLDGLMDEGNWSFGTSPSVYPKELLQRMLDHCYLVPSDTVGDLEPSVRYHCEMNNESVVFLVENIIDKWHIQMNRPVSDYVDDLTISFGVFLKNNIREDNVVPVGELCVKQNDRYIYITTYLSGGNVSIYNEKFEEIRDVPEDLITGQRILDALDYVMDKFSKGKYGDEAMGESLEMKGLPMRGELVDTDDFLVNVISKG